MAKTKIKKEFLEQIFKAIPSILSSPYKKMFIDYDESADVLYISKKQNILQLYAEGKSIYKNSK
jgi:hypothetical protein